jgi:hypothetical protein
MAVQFVDENPRLEGRKFHGIRDNYTNHPPPAGNQFPPYEVGNG